MSNNTPTAKLPAQHQAALNRLVELAKKDTGGATRAANFLLAWWNAEECGGFDLTDLWNVDPDTASDMLLVFAFVASKHSYPDTLGYKADFKQIISRHRPKLLAETPESSTSDPHSVWKGSQL